MNPLIPLFSSRRFLSALGALAMLLAGFASVRQDPEAFGLYPCSGRLRTAAQIAAFRHISLETLLEVKAARGLTIPEACAIPQDKLERAIFRTANPKPDHPGEAVALRNLQMQDENGYIPPDGFEKASEHIEAMSAVPQLEGFAAGITSASWTWIGPGNIGGRVRSLAIHPTEPNIMWAGSVSGGIWKTTDAGASWQILDDFMANMAVSTLVIDPVDPDSLYAGTGEGFYNSDNIRGAGVFKTTDGGMTWTQLASTANSSWYYVNRLAINPSNPSILLAANETGIYKSTDGGASWTLKEGSRRYLDINFSPDGTRAVASSGFGIALFSSNAGETWTPATFVGGLGALDWEGRIEVAFAHSDPSIVYASVNNSNGQVWRSTDFGQTYSLANTGNSYLGSQGWYDNIIWVDPTNANLLMVGGIDLWRSTDGGTTLTKVSQWFSAPVHSAHADHHIIVEHPGFDGETNKTVFFGNDGGVYRADDYSSVALTSGWTELNNNLGITQFYGGAGSPLNGIIVGGTQDNGTLLYNPDTGAEGWTSEFGGDGGWSAIDPADPNYVYGEYVYGQVHRSIDGGNSAEYIWGRYWNGSAWDYKPAPYKITEAEQKKGNFIAPLILDPNDPNRLYVGLESLWKTNDVKTPGGEYSSIGPSWYAVKAAATGNPISAIAVLKGNSNVIWVGHINGDVYKTTNGTSPTPTWTKMDAGATPLPNRYVTRITPHPTNPGTVYVTFGGFSTDNVWRTSDNGATWADRTGSGLTGLPDAPVRSLVLHPDFPSWIYAGTEVGVFTSEDAGLTWKLPHDGPTNTSVDELFWLNYTLVAATHGRGMYKIAVISPITVPMPEMNVKGNNRSIASGDTTPSATDHTDFGLVDVASAGMDRTFIIQNTGEDDLDLTGTPTVSISGTHAADFSVTMNPSTSVAPSGSTDFTVHFSPRGLGLRTATVSIENDDPNENPYSFYVQGTGDGCFPAITVTTNANNGAGSLRQALLDICVGGTIDFNNDYTIPLSSTLAINKDLTIDGAGHTVILDGQNTVRVLYIDWSPVRVTIRNLTVRNGRTNSYGAGILNFGDLNVETSTFANNSAVDQGGAIINYAGVMNVTNSTFSGNSAKYGGGIFNYSGATLAVTNTTLSDNQASTSGGGIFNQGAMDIRNTIIAHSTGHDCVNAGTIGAKTNNLIEGAACDLENGVDGNLIGQDPKLGALASNGGPTQTMVLLNGSPAFNAGDDAACAASPVSGVDQRGMARPQGAHCDIGSYEAEVITITASDKAITYGDPDPAFDFTKDPSGAGLSAEPVCSVSGAHTNAGTYPITCSGGVPTDTKYLIEYRNGTLTVQKADPPVTLSVTNSPAVYSGASRSAIVVSSGTPGSVSGIKYDGSSTAPINAGAYAVAADFLPTDTTNYNSLSDLSAGDFIIEKATPSLSVTNSPVTYNSLPQPASVSGSVAGIPNNLLYNGSSTVPTDAGVYTVTADFMPNDTHNYNSLVGAPAGDFIIDPATPAAALRVTNSYVVYNGSAQTATVVISTSSVPGEIANIRYNGSATLPVSAGNYLITADFVPAVSINYRTLTGLAAGSFIIQAERAKNGGFNSYAGTSNIPANWDKSSTFTTTDGKDIKVKQEGSASVKIAGNGKSKTLTQSIPLGGKAGDRLDFSFWARGASIPTAGACQAQVLLYSGTILKETKTVKCSNGTYTTFRKRGLSFNASSAFTKVVIKITYSKAGGTVWFDLVSLVK